MKSSEIMKMCDLLSNTVQDVQWRRLNVTDQDGNRVGIVTTCINHTLKRLSFSFCSPKDRYNRDYGRWLAFVRQKAPENRVKKCWRSFDGTSTLTSDFIREACMDVAVGRNVQWFIDTVKLSEQIK